MSGTFVFPVPMALHGLRAPCAQEPDRWEVGCVEDRGLGGGKSRSCNLPPEQGRVCASRGREFSQSLGPARRHFVSIIADGLVITFFMKEGVGTVSACRRKLT